MPTIHRLFTARCEVSCVHGSCGASGCICDREWTGERCDQRSCDARCANHGQCHNGTCVCIQGWNGRHCTIRELQCHTTAHVSAYRAGTAVTVPFVSYRGTCVCIQGWTGRHCTIHKLHCHKMAHVSHTVLKVQHI